MTSNKENLDTMNKNFNIIPVAPELPTVLAQKFLDFYALGLPLNRRDNIMILNNSNIYDCRIKYFSLKGNQNTLRSPGSAPKV